MPEESKPVPNPIVEQAAKALGLTQLLPTAYCDLLQPFAQVTGQQLITVAKAVGIALAPLEAAVWGYQRIKEYLAIRLAVRLADKPVGEICSPNPVIAGPAIMNMAFAADAPYLREMYANLLARAMHAPHAEEAHPAFVQVIQQLSSDEAIILQQLVKEYKGGDTIFSASADYLTSVQEISTGAVQSDWPIFCSKFKLRRADLCPTYLDNLLRLRILAIRTSTQTERTLKYGPRDDDFANQPEEFLSGGENSVLYITDYGSSFLSVCVAD